jgi:hypothetical protein
MSNILNESFRETSLRFPWGAIRFFVSIRHCGWVVELTNERWPCRGHETVNHTVCLAVYVIDMYSHRLFIISHKAANVLSCNRLLEKWMIYMLFYSILHILLWSQLKCVSSYIHANEWPEWWNVFALFGLESYVASLQLLTSIGTKLKVYRRRSKNPTKKTVWLAQLVKAPRRAAVFHGI